MSQSIELLYVFDPFCGWCYASAPALAGLATTFPDQLRMMPSGLFMTPRPTSAIAHHAWTNDQRIESLTGQQFSQAYHRNVLLAPEGVFSSAPATLALQAVGETDPRLEPALLHELQIARYVAGQDTSREDEVAKVVAALALRQGIALTAPDFAARLREDVVLRDRALHRIDGVQGWMETLGLRGVPQLVAMLDGRPTVLSGDLLYHGPERLIAAIEGLRSSA